ncbi:hypothetical protein CPB84DRAFT_1794342 [Gymnopilus junonius]|uniref:Uncharacterized protein n=1 Tax=Gymnopilus junonius TaxID=109634 RepID=A0A9P5THW3_GYMJU|nr:hypothetical protein CPB84DRAFT_1794342 [Gymnopilus junonius]
MSTTTTETSRTRSPFLHVVASIPMISSSLGTINDTLTNNSYTRYPYAQRLRSSHPRLTSSQSLSRSNWPHHCPRRQHANKAIDVVESRYPYPFRAQPVEVQETVSKAINEKVTTPAYNRFAPLVDYIESKVKGSESVPSAVSQERHLPNTKLNSSIKLLRTNIGRHLHDQSSIVQTASKTASSVSASSYERINALSDNMLAQLRKLQEASSSFTASLSGPSIQSRMTPIRQSYEDFAAALSILCVSDVLARSHPEPSQNSNGHTNGDAAPVNGNAQPHVKEEGD